MRNETTFHFDKGIDISELRKRQRQASQILEEFEKSHMAQNVQILSSISINIAKLDN